MKFRKKPVVIEAVQWKNSDESRREIADFCGTHAEWRFNLGDVHVHTLEGVMTARPDDWIIRGVKGEFYPVKPDIFSATYEPVEEASDEQG